MFDRGRRRCLALLGSSALMLTARARAAAPDATAGLDAPFSRALLAPGRDGLLDDVAADAPLTLTAGVRRHRVFTGGLTDIWNYSARTERGPTMNPLLRVSQGSRLDVTLDNQLGDDTTIHWHGLAVDEANDGSGLHPVRHGERYRYEFEVRNRAGLYWYHAHPHGRTGEQVHKGLAGLLIIDDDVDRALRERLELSANVTDLPLMLADKQVNRHVAIKYGLGEDDWIGNRMLVNWTPTPYREVARRLHRLRLANTSNARTLRIAFLRRGKPERFALIGTDGGLLERAQTVREVFLAPAQRIDVLFDFARCAPGERVRLTSLAYDPMENDAGPGMAMDDPATEHPGAVPMGAALDIMEFRCSDSREQRIALPRSLAPLPRPDTRGAKVRELRLSLTDAGRWLINDWNFQVDGHRPVFAVKRGSREIWRFSNALRSMPHPMHAHGFQFHVLARRDSPAQVRRLALGRDGRTAQDLGLCDTVLVWPGETVDVLIDFSQPFAGEQVYMLHCHNLEHEDQGMMVSFAVS